MRIVQQLDLSELSISSQDYEFYHWGAQGVIWSPLGCAGSRMVWTCGNIGFTRTRLLMWWQCGPAQGHDDYDVALPLCGDILRIDSQLVGTLRGRLRFVDEPIAPYGRSYLQANTGATAASGTVEPFGSGPFAFGDWKSFYVGVEANRTVMVEAQFVWGAITTGWVPLAFLEDAAGGARISPAAPMPPGLSLRIRNLDAINSVSWNIWLMASMDAPTV